MTRFSTLLGLAALAAASLFFSCKKNAPASAETPKPAASDKVSVPSDALFQLLDAGQTGVNFVNTVSENHQLNIFSYGHLYNGGGVGVLDLNRDGLQDLYFTSTMGPCKLYLNRGNLKFEDITDRAGVSATGGIKTAVAVADVNSDGWPDIYVCRSGPNEHDLRRNILFLNQQNGTFRDVAAEWGVDDIAPTSSANFFDYDYDGDLDLFLVNTQLDFSKTSNMNVKDLGNGKFVRDKKLQPGNNPQRLFRNDGKRFTDVTEKAGLLDFAYGFSSVASDLNDDNAPDLYVGNDFIVPDFMYKNNRNGTFSEITTQATRHLTNHTMGTDVEDLNNDGRPEIFTLDMLPEDFPLQQQRASTMKDERFYALFKHGYGTQFMRNCLQLNLGVPPAGGGIPQFADIGCLAGVYATDWSWAPLMQDFDNDGYRDIFVTNGYFRDGTNADFMEFTMDSIGKLGGTLRQHFPKIEDLLVKIPQFKLLNYLYRNRGGADAGLGFDDVSQAWGLAEKSFSNGAAYADLDNDGDLDLVVNNLMSPAFIYQNMASDRRRGNWLQLKLAGSPKNPFATGAKVRAWASDGRIFSEELTPCRGFWSSVEPLVHFGLGSLQKLDKVEVLFPEGKLVRLTDVSANQRLAVQFADAKPGQLTPLPAAKPMFREISGQRGLAFKHEENDFHDFDRERLLPWKLSMPGPPLASADVNGDGTADFYIGGATGQAGALFLQSKSGSFSTTSAKTWEADKGFEDAGATFFDADGDSDQDLLVASGGDEAPAGSPAYQARLYLNDGKGNFARDASALPQFSESEAAVVAHDFDGDGDADIFLGGYCWPERYPESPWSHVLRNDKGKFTDVTHDVAPDFKNIGMVRAMQWVDLEGDKSPELLVALEWGPVAVFKNSGGRLVDATAKFGLDEFPGIWRSLCAGDFDGDGDVDFVAGNLGQNTRLTASPKEPLTMYAADFDNNGSLDPILCRTWQGTERPLAFHKQILKQMPVLKKKFLRAKDYSEATVGDLFGKPALEKALRLRATTLATTYFENRGGHFEAHPLPAFAQIAPTCSVVAADVNRDGHLDLILAGNDLGQQIETQWIDSGSGCVLLGDGKGGFRPLWPRESGFWAVRDARCLAVLAGGRRVVLVGNCGGGMQGFEF